MGTSGLVLLMPHLLHAPRSGLPPGIHRFLDGGKESGMSILEREEEGDVRTGEDGHLCGASPALNCAASEASKASRSTRR